MVPGPSQTAVNEQVPAQAAVNVLNDQLVTDTVQEKMFESNTYSSSREACNDRFSETNDSRTVGIPILKTFCDTADLKQESFHQVDSPTSDAIPQTRSVPDSICKKEENDKECDWKRHIHNMFLARVLVGSYTEGRRLFRRPPPIDFTNPYGRTYHSCVNYVDDPSLFVLFDSAQYYPQYLIHYINKSL